MTSLKTSIKTITYLSDTGCLEIQGASLPGNNVLVNNTGGDLNIISSDSILNGATKLVSGTTTLKLSENTIWNMKDDSVVTHLTNSDSIINLSYDDGQTFTQGKTLTVKGNYVGLKWHTEFGHLNRGDMLTSEQHRCSNEKKKF
ncbi:hypothetical protein C5K24_25795 [Shigella boydii]|nr:hypothetical protein C5K23_24000 [Shigella boydii]PQN40960.1 hypothetical protein C5K24_25795 [Shigella boydii]